MLKIGQEVYIRREPYDGEEYFDFDGDDCARISGLVAYGEEVLYQLDRYPDDCLWCGDDLDATGHNYCTNEPLFDVHDEVFVGDNPTVRKIHSIYRGIDMFRYLFADEGPNAHVGIPGVFEKELTLYRKHGETVDDYTLF